ncbi:MAG: hypothetical protein P8Z68_04130 [Kineosporiaceae bacterium]|jgi:hypothetical protein
MFALTTLSSAIASQSAPAGGDPPLVMLALGALVVILFAGAGLFGAVLRLTSTALEVLAGLGKSAISGLSRVVALVGLAALVVFLLQLVSNHQI